jgi:hypothetical protein
MLVMPSDIRTTTQARPRQAATGRMLHGEQAIVRSERRWGSRHGRTAQMTITLD